MRIYYFLFIVIFLNCDLFAQEFIQVGCQLFNLSGQLVKKENGLNCAFLKNGSTIIVEKDSVKFFEQMMNLK